jgi:hypothetical protein
MRDGHQCVGYAVQIFDSAGVPPTTIARANTKEVTRHKAYGTMNRKGSGKPNHQPMH